MGHSKLQVRIFVFSDHAMFRHGLTCLLNAEPGFSVVASTGDRDTAMNLVVELKPDLLLCDVTGSKLHLADAGLQVLRYLSSKEQEVRVILLTASNDEGQIVDVLKLGVRGVVQKEASSTLLFKCIRSVMDGGYWISRKTTCELVKSLESLNAMLEQMPKLMGCNLSWREMQVIKEVISGSTNKDIAKKLSISEQAVKYRLTKIFGKTGASGRMNLARFAIRNQLIREA